MIQDLDIQEIRQQLESEVVRVQGQIVARSTKTGQRSRTNLDRGDLAQNFAIRERRLAIRDVEEEQLTQINKALERIAAGTYGTCAGCGEAIAAGRLEVMPYAIMCIRCQQEQDKKP